jgi:hypothetical protein
MTVLPGGPGYPTVGSRCVNGTCGAQKLYTPGCITEWVVDATHLYWTCQTNGTVSAAPKDGSGPVTTVASGQSSPNGIAVDATHVYWANTGDGTVRSAPLGASGTATLASNLSTPTLLHLGGGYAWVLAGVSLLRVPIGGGPAVTVWTNTSANYPPGPIPNGPGLSLVGLATDAASVYWSTPAQVYQTSPTTPLFCATGSVYSMPLAGGTPGVISTGNAIAPGPSRLTSDGKTLYGFRDSTLYAGICDAYDVVRMPVQGGPFVALEVFSPSGSLPFPPDPASDGIHAYWGGLWYPGLSVATRDDWMTCNCQRDTVGGGVCPLVDRPSVRLAIDGSYLYIADGGSIIWRTFK